MKLYRQIKGNSVRKAKQKIRFFLPEVADFVRNFVSNGLFPIVGWWGWGEQGLKLANREHFIAGIIFCLLSTGPSKVSIDICLSLRLFCTDLAAVEPHFQDLGPLFFQYGPRAWLIK